MRVLRVVGLSGEHGLADARWTVAKVADAAWPHAMDSGGLNLAFTPKRLLSSCVPRICAVHVIWQCEPLHVPPASLPVQAMSPYRGDGGMPSAPPHEPHGMCGRVCCTELCAPRPHLLAVAVAEPPGRAPGQVPTLGPRVARPQQCGPRWALVARPHELAANDRVSGYLFSNSVSA